MARLLTAAAADSTSAADRFGDRLVALGLWLLGCLAAGATAIAHGAHQYCSPRDYHGAYPHSLLGGWTPCAVSLLLTGVPSFVAAVAIGAAVNKGRKLRRNKGNNAGGERPGSQALTASSCWHRWTVVAAFFAFFALRIANLYPKVEDDQDGVNVWEVIDLTLFALVWELIIFELFEQRTLRRLQEQTPNQPHFSRLFHLRTPLMAALALADVVKTMLIARPPWQSLTDANKNLPIMGGLYAGSLVLEAYMLMGIACEHRLAAAATAADGSAANMKEPLLVDDGAAGTRESAAVDTTAADDVPAEP